MGGHTLKFTPFLLPLVFFLLLPIPIPIPIPIHANENACAKVDCVKGTCVPYSDLEFDCVCYSGWKKIQIGPLQFPTCILPNCTVNLQCGNGAPPSPPPPPFMPPPIDLLNPCNFVWCGDGNCVAVENGKSHKCECHEGSANLFNLTDLPCFKQCSFGVDCSGLGLATPQPPPNGIFASVFPPDGSNNISKSSWTWEALNMILFSAIILEIFL